MIFVTKSMIKNEQQAILSGLRKLGIDTLIKKIESGYTFNKDTPEIQAILTLACQDKNLSKIKQFQPKKKTVKGTEVIPFISSLLNLVGIPIKHCEKARGEDGKQKHWYGLAVEEYYYCNYKSAMLESIERKYKEWLEKDYIKPDWDYLKKEGQLPDEFRKVMNDEEITANTYNESIEELLQASSVTFTDKEEGLINYQLPDKHILKISKLYHEFLQGKRELNSIHYSEYAMAKATKLLKDAERYSAVKELLEPLLMS